MEISKLITHDEAINTEKSNSETNQRQSSQEEQNAEFVRDKKVTSNNTYTNPDKNFRLAFPDQTKVKFIEWTDNDSKDLDLKLCFDDEMSDCENSIGSGDTILVKTYQDIEKNIKPNLQTDLYDEINQIYASTAPLQHAIFNSMRKNELTTINKQTWYITTETDSHAQYTAYHLIKGNNLYIVSFGVNRSPQHIKNVLSAFSTL